MGGLGHGSIQNPSGAPPALMVINGSINCFSGLIFPIDDWIPTKRSIFNSPGQSA